MSFGGAWFFDDYFDDLLYSDSKWNSIKYLFMGLILWLIIFPMTMIFSFILGFFNNSKYRRCDRCGKDKLNDVRSSNKFYWFCDKCSKKYSKLEDSFLRDKLNETKESK